MKQVFVSGTLGDAYTVGLKLMKEDDDIEILHHTNHKQFYKQIFEVYNFFDNIQEVNFVEFLYPDIRELSGVPEKEMVWFPHLELLEIDICKENYITLSPHTGRDAPDPMRREIPIETVEYMIDFFAPVPVVLLGTNIKYKNVKCYLNLINETTITEAASIIINSSGFCGPEGFPTFVALSHKIPSIIFWARLQPVQARLLNNPWMDHIVDLIKL